MAHLTKKQIGVINDIVDELFDRLKVRLLGPQAVNKRLDMAHMQDYTLPAMFIAAAAEENCKPSLDSIHSAMDIADSYVDAYRETAKARVVKEISAFLSDVDNKGERIDVEAILNDKLQDVWKDISTSVSKMIDVEVNTVKNLGVVEGVTRASSEQGIDDPVVFFVVVRDEKLCDECRRLHIMGDGHTPRLWFMSEVEGGYHKKGYSHPKISGLHPHCRCTINYCPIGYGFDAGGRLIYKGPAYDAIAVQRHLRRSEFEEYEELKKFLPDGLVWFRENLVDTAIDNYLKHKEQHDLEPVNPPHDLHFSQAVADWLNNSPMASNVPLDRLEGIAKTGFFYNLGRVPGRGTTHMPTRMEHEQRVYGIPMEMPWEERPIYGALWFGHFKNSGNGPAPHYGELFFTVKDHVKSRTTITPDDTFGCNPDQVFLMRPEHMKTFARMSGKQFAAWLPGATGYGGGGGYCELQYHGGLRLDRDIKEIHITPMACMSPEQLDRLLGIGKDFKIAILRHQNNASRQIEKTVLYDPGSIKDRSIEEPTPTVERELIPEFSTETQRQTEDPFIPEHPEEDPIAVASPSPSRRKRTSTKMCKTCGVRGKHSIEGECENCKIKILSKLI